MSILQPPQQLIGAALVAANTKNQIRAAYNQLTSTFATSTRNIWNNPQYAPQEIFDAFGTDGAQLFQLAAAVSTLIGTVTGTTPASPVPAEYSYVINVDGSITVTENQSSSSSSGS